MEFMPVVVTTLGACVVAVVTTTLGAWVAVPFAMRRFRKERRWERRAEAYERVVQRWGTSIGVLRLVNRAPRGRCEQTMEPEM